MPTYTVTIAGVERHDGEKPYDFVVDQPNEQAARQAVEAHFRKEQETDDTEILGVKSGVPSRGVFNDLRPKRIQKVAKALKPYKDANDLQAPVVDFLTDLQHYCLSVGVEFEDVVRIARGHFDAENAPEVDFQVRNNGSTWSFTPLTERAKGFTETDLQLESWQWMGDSFHVDHRPAADLARALQDEGFVVD